MPNRTIVQPGTSLPSDLFAYFHASADIVQNETRAATDDAVVAEFWGQGTSAYSRALAAYGGSWDSYVAGLERKLNKPFWKTCLTTWSAGSQFAKDACRAMLDAGELGGEKYAGRLDALVMLDGMYSAKPPGAKPGDGKVLVDRGLSALFYFALAAARGECVMVVLHSAIVTPYASSGECAAALREFVESEMGVKMSQDASLGGEFVGRKFSEALALGDLHLVGFPGNDAKEHVAEAHLFDEAWRRWVPWARDRVEAPAPEPTPTLGELALRLSLAEVAAGAREDPPGSDRTDPKYWAGCTRTVGKTEVILKLDRGPWCAGGFQWATYEAARQLGLLDGKDQALAWLAGPVPHGRRVSVLELQNDMKARGLFRPASVVRSESWKPRPGDAVFLDRPGGPSAGWGHVRRFVEDLGDGKFRAIGANEGDRWGVGEYRYDDPLLRGFGSFWECGKDLAGAKPMRAEEAVTLEACRAEYLARDRD